MSDSTFYGKVLEVQHFTHVNGVECGEHWWYTTMIEEHKYIVYVVAGDCRIWAEHRCECGADVAPDMAKLRPLALALSQPLDMDPKALRIGVM